MAARKRLVIGWLVAVPAGKSQSDTAAASTTVSEFDRWTALAHAINAGNYLNATSLQPILESQFSADRTVAAISELQRIQPRVIEGQALDFLISERDPRSIAIGEILDLYRRKTASYTVTAPLVAGYRLSPEAVGTPAQLRQFGRHIGTAYQITDDLLELFSTANPNSGPPSDLVEGKRTLPLVLAFQNGTLDQRERLATSMAEDLDENTADTIREIIVETGAKAESEAIADDLLTQGLDTIENLDTPFLESIASLTTTRNY